MSWKLAMHAALATDLIDISWKNFQARAKLIRLEIKTKGENLWDRCWTLLLLFAFETNNGVKAPIKNIEHKICNRE